MPPLPNVPNVVKLALIFSDGVNNDIVTRLHYRYSGAAPSNASMLLFLDDVSGLFSADVVGAMFTGLSLIRLEGTDLTSPTAAQAAETVSVAGTRAGPPVAIDSAFVTSYVIPRRYRGGHARGYWPLGVAGDLLNPQQWLGSFVAGVTASLDPFFAGIAAGPGLGSGALTQVNVSYYHGFTVVTNPITGRARNVPTVRGTPVVDTVTSRVDRLRVGTQRRRAQYG